MENKSKLTVELKYSATTSINLVELLQGLDTNYSHLDIVGLSIKHGTLYLDMKDGEQLSTFIHRAIENAKPSYKYPSSIKVSNGDNILAEESREGYGVEIEASSKEQE